MDSLLPAFLERLYVPPRLVRTLTALAEVKGKQALWAQTKPEVLRELRKIALIESAESSSRMENVEVSPHTFVSILRHAEPPDSENRSQAELADCRDALDLVQQNAADMSPTEGPVRQLHQTLMRYSPVVGGEYKHSPNDIVRKTPRERLPAFGSEQPLRH